MPIYKPSELRQFLDSLGINPRKSLSQNFLIDGNIIRKIISAAHVTPQDVVLEIGPGPGSLSEALLDAGAKVIAVEKDKVLADALNRLKTAGKDIDIHTQDILEFPIENALSEHLTDGKKAKVIANLPYHLTTPILARLVLLHQTFQSITVMVQEEVARRFTAKPGTSDYSSFTVFLNFYSSPRYAFTVSKHCFYPEPKIQSAVVTLDLKTPPLVSDQQKFFEMTRTAFEHRRKMLRGSLRSLYDPKAIEQALAEIGQNTQARPEELSLEEFLLLFEKLNP